MNTTQRVLSAIAVTVLAAATAHAESPVANDAVSFRSAFCQNNLHLTPLLPPMRNPSEKQFLSVDPHEMINLAGKPKYQVVVSEMFNQLTHELARTEGRHD